MNNMTGSEVRVATSVGATSSPFWSTGIDKLKAYVPGEQPQTDGWVKLNTNECPYPPSPLALAAIREATSDKLRLYPDPNGTALKGAIAKQFGLGVDHVFLGNGSDEVLGHAFLGLLKHELPILYPDVSYSFYPVYCGLYGIGFQQLPLIVEKAAAGLASANVTVLNGSDGLSEIVSGLVGQGLAIFDSIRSGVGASAQASSAPGPHKPAAEPPAIDHSRA